MDLPSHKIPMNLPSHKREFTSVPPPSLCWAPYPLISLSSETSERLKICWKAHKSQSEHKLGLLTDFIGERFWAQFGVDGSSLTSDVVPMDLPLHEKEFASSYHRTYVECAVSNDIIVCSDLAVWVDLRSVATITAFNRRWRRAVFN